MFQIKNTLFSVLLPLYGIIAAVFAVNDPVSPPSILEVSPLQEVVDTTSTPTKSGGVLLPFICQPNFYQVYGALGAFARYNALDIDDGFEDIFEFGFGANAMAYNPIDNFIYAIKNDTKEVLKIGRDGEWENLGSIGLPNKNIYVGEFLPDGRYLVKGGEPEIYDINILTMDFSTIYLDVDFRAADWAYNYTNDKLYGVGGTTLYSYEPSTDEVDFFPLTGFLGNDNGAFGGAFYTVDGFIYVSNNGSGNIYRIDIANRQVKYVISGPDNISGNDGAGCPFALPPFPVVYANNDEIRIRKETSKKVRVTNNDSAQLSDVDRSSVEVVSDPLHGEYSVNNSGEITYFPDEGFGGIDSLEYQVCGNSFIVVCDIAKVYIYVAHQTFETETICDGETYYFGNRSYNRSGVYEYIEEDDDGVETIATLDLTVLDPIETDITATICEGEIYEFDGEDYEEEGTYEIFLENYIGCDSLIILDLTVLPREEEYIEESICSDESYQLEGNTYDETGVYEIIIEDDNGCEGSITLDLTVFEKQYEYIEEEICEGEIYRLGGQSFSATGVYELELEDDNGCFNETTLDLIVFEKQYEYIEEEICDGETYRLGGQSFSATGIYELELEDDNGCLNETTLDLIVHEEAIGIVAEEICHGENYYFNDRTYNEEGTYEHYLTAESGCDSVAILELTVLEHSETFLEAEICDGDSYQFGGRNYTTSGIYEDVYLAANGCDSVITLELMVINIPDTDIEAAICNGETYQFGDEALSEAGNYSRTIAGYLDCDSTINLSLEVLEHSYTALEESICDGDQYIFNGEELIEEGIYTATLSAINGCDSIITLNLIVLDNKFETLTEEICRGEKYFLNEEVYEAAGTYIQNLRATNGCDSTLTLDLTLLEHSETYLTKEVCYQESFTVGNNTYNETGEYEDYFIAANGCDSIVYLSLVVLEQPLTQLDETLCAGESLQIGFTRYTHSGFFTTILKGYNDCDSIVELDLTVLAPIKTNITQIICEGESFTLGEEVFSTTGMYEVEFQTTELGCDSIVNLDLQVILDEEITQQISICEGESYSIGESEYTTTGVYTDVLGADNGCNSQVTTELTVLEHSTATIDAAICTGSSYTFGENALTEAGTYIRTISSFNGCDSTIILNLVILEDEYETLNEGVCHGEKYYVDGEEYDREGSYTIIQEAENGCVKYLTLNLVELEHSETVIDKSVCEGDNYVLNGVNYYQSGTYEQVLRAANDCDSLIVLNLSIVTDEAVEVNASICVGESYSIGMENFDQAGTYTVVEETELGCPKTTLLTLTTIEPSLAEVQAQICEGGSYSFNGEDYTTNGFYPVTLVASNGCDSIVTLNLEVLSKSYSEISTNICEGELYTLGNNTYSSSGVYTETLLAANGCDSVITLNLEVLTEQNITLNESICQGEAFIIGEETYTANGNYVVNLTGQNGCDSIVELNLNILPNYETSLNKIICAGDTYQLGTASYTESGTYTAHFTSTNGCDSIATLDLTVIEDNNAIIEATICEGETYQIGDALYSQTGTYINTITTDSDCEAQITTYLTVLAPVTSFVEETICAGQNYILGFSNYSETGIYTETLTNFSGCDSIVTLDLTVLEAVEISINESICSGGNYSIGEESYSATGSYQNTLVASNGCDSIVTLNLTVLPPTEGELIASICVGETFTLEDEAYTTAGSYTQLVQTATGCDSLVHIQLSTITEIETQLSASICAGEHYRLGEETYAQTGLYTQRIENSTGCDSLYYLDLVVLPEAEIALEASICRGDSYELGAENYSTSGIYTQVLTTVNGCDSTVTLMLEVLEQSTTQLAAEICTGSTYQVGEEIFDESGIYNVHLNTYHGCDSIITLDLTVEDVLRTTLDVEICTGDSYEMGGESYDETGIYALVFSAEGGCDSIVNLRLEVSEELESALTATICAGETYEFGGDTFDESGNYTTTFISEYGCDSLVYLDLRVQDALSTNIAATICAGEIYEIGNTAFSENGTHTVLLTSAAGCDSTVVLGLEILPEITTSLKADICSGTSYEIGENTFNQTGVYAIALTSTTGCDSLITLDLIVEDVLTTELNVTLCNGDTYELGDMSYHTSGTYTNIFTAVGGCDSLVTLNLDITNQLESNVAADICSGEVFEVGEESFTESGFYTIMLNSEYGCDSLVYLDLNVEEVLNTELTASICVGTSYDIGTESYTESGEYTTILRSESGCDSTILLKLEVTDQLETTLNANICTGSSYELGGVEFSESGIYNLTLTSVNGCDSLITLDLQVEEELQSEIEASICAGEAYELGAANYSEAGTYMQTLTASTGCDSTVTLQLSVISQPEIVLAPQTLSCNGESVVLFAGDFNSYNWSNGSTNASTIVDSEGEYSVTVTNEAGCEATNTTIVSIVEVPEPLVDNFTAPTSCDTNDGSIFISPTEGNFLYSIDGGYTWQTEGAFTELGSGKYPIMMSSIDTFCQVVAMDSIRLASPDALIIEDVTISEPDNCDRTNGQIEILASGSNDGYLYSIDNGQTWQSSSLFSNIPIGDYQFLVSRPDTSCVTMNPSIITLTAPANLEIARTEIQQPLCAAEATGSVDVTVTGGFPPYDYFWSNGATIANLEELSAGNYELTVTDEKGCEFITSITIEETAIFTIDAHSDFDTTICNGQIATLSVEEEGERFTWRNNDSILSETDSLLVDESGTYLVEVTNSEGCIAIDSVEVAFSATEVEADFLMSAEGLVDEPIVAVEITWPIPDSVRWEYDTSVARTERSEQNHEVITFLESGIHDVTLYVYSDDCVAKVKRTINIVDDPSQLINPQIARPDFTEILEFILFPNPNNGIFNVRIVMSDRSPVKLMIFHEQGQMIDERSLNGEYLYLEDYNLSGLVPGVYAIVIQTGTEWRYSAFVVD